MRNLKKVICMLLLCTIILYQHYITFAEIFNPSKPPQYTMRDSYGHFAEKNHILYYFNMITEEYSYSVSETYQPYEKDNLSLYQYDINTKTESLLCEDVFRMCSDIHICDDGYIYFRAIRLDNDDDIQKFYRVPISGGKSECIYDNIEKIIFISDTWAYDSEKNIFFNFITNETIENTITDNIPYQNRYYYHDISFFEYQDTVYLYTYANYAYENSEEIIRLKYKNGEKVENGLYALPLHNQTAFYKIDLGDNFYKDFYFYNNNLYCLSGKYLNENYDDRIYTIKEYSLQNHTTRTIVSTKDVEEIKFLGIYNDTLYYYCRIVKSERRYPSYPNVYGILLNDKQNQPFIVLPYAMGYHIHIFEDVICCGALSPDWRVFNYKTRELYDIRPYEYKGGTGK